MLTIAPGTSHDVPALVSLDHIAARSPERGTAIADWTAAGQCYVARLDGYPVGYVALTDGFFHAPFIEMLMVAESARRRGIAGALVRHCIALVPEGEKLWTSTNQSNAPMCAMLPRLGFVTAGRVDHLDEGDPELVYLHWSRLPR